MSELLSTENRQGQPSTKAGAEKLEARYKRPMPKFEPFKETEARRPDFDAGEPWKVTKTPMPDWKPGQGANKKAPEGKKHVMIDPSDRKRGELLPF